MGNSNSNMVIFRRWILWVTLGMIVLLLVLSVIGSFRGADKASELFNSDPLVVFWVSLTGLLALGICFFPRLMRKPGLLSIHLGSILILLGAMWNSERGHQVQKDILGIDKITHGYMAFRPGESKNNILTENLDPHDALGKLPFSIRVEDCWADYYWGEGALYIRFDPKLAQQLSADTPPQNLAETSSDKEAKPHFSESNQNDSLPAKKTSESKARVQEWQIPDRIGEEIEFQDPNELRKIKVLRVLRNLKVDERVTDRSKEFINPSIVIRVEWADGSSETGYVFYRSPHQSGRKGYKFAYVPNFHKAIMSPKDYYSDLQVLDYENKVQHRQVIEVNKPLHYGGYHFYQNRYRSDFVFTPHGIVLYQPRSTGLSVFSDSGVSVVFLGYWLLCTGVVWQCWLQHIVRYLRKRSQNGI